MSTTQAVDPRAAVALADLRVRIMRDALDLVNPLEYALDLPLGSPLPGDVFTLSRSTMEELRRLAVSFARDAADAIEAEVC